MPGYMALIPDINAARIEGPGEGSLMAAGAAMNGLGAAIEVAADSVTASVATLSSVGWTGPSGASTAAAFIPNGAWMREHSAKCMAIGAKHIAFAEAYRAANLMIPKVPVVAENQSEHVMLQASNIFGVNGAAIAANRAVYQAMWTAAGTAMDTYSSVGAVESTPIPAEPPIPITSMGIGMIASAVSTGVETGVGLAQGAMNGAASGLSAMTGAGTAAGTAAASSAGPAAAQALGLNGTTGANGQAPGTPTAGKDVDAQQLTSLLGQAPQALAQVPQALGQAPQAFTQAVSGPSQAVMGPLQNLMTSGGSGLGGAPTGAGLNGLSGLYPGSLANAADAAERSAARSAGLTRSAGIGGIGGGSGGFAMPSGWRSTADTMGISAAPASGIGAGRPVAGGADLRTSAAGSGMGPMMAPASSMAGARRGGTRAGASLSWEEDPFGAEEDDDLPMTLTASGERGT